MDLYPTGSYARSMDATKVSLGLLLLAVSGVILFVSGAASADVPLGALVVAAVGLSVGALLVGTGADEGRPV
jgi:hypothetical protein